MRIRISTRWKAGLAAVTFALAVASFAGSISSAAGAPGAHRTSGATVKTSATTLGRILVDASGRSLYLYEKDKGGRSACYTACAQVWTPLLTNGKPVAGTGAKASLLGITIRTGGTHQVTYAGHPLYRYALDKQPGQTKGEGSKAFGADWYVLSPAGTKIDKS